MGKPDTPTPPDPVATAQAQTQSNIATATSNAALNRVDTNTPYGSLNYTTTGSNPDGTPKYQADVTLSPSEQKLFDVGTANQGTLADTAAGMLGQVQNSYASPINTSGLPGIQSSVSQDGDTANAIKQAQDAAYKSQTQYLDPQYANAEDEQRTRLANQGVVQGSDAYNKADQQLALQKQQAYQSAQNAATTAGQNEQNTLFGQGATNASLNNQAQTQGLSQLFALRNQPLNEYNALATGSQVQSPSFPNVPGATVANTNTAGIAQSSYQDQLQNAQLQQQGINNLFSLGGQLGAAAILA